MTPDDADRLCSAVQAWAAAQQDFGGMAIVGSRARGTARADSDLDILLLTDTPDGYRNDPAWVSAIDWQRAGFAVASFRDADYGAVWSRHVALDPTAEVEFTFAAPSWAAIDPPDDGTAAVVGNGCRIVYDRVGLLRRLLRHLDLES